LSGAISLAAPQSQKKFTLVQVLGLFLRREPLAAEVIQELELPKYDLEIIPSIALLVLCRTEIISPLGDHAKTRREIARHSTTDADAYEQYGQLMVQMAMAVKPLLGIIPLSQPPGIEGAFRTRLGGQSFSPSREKLLYDLTKLMTMSSADFWTNGLTPKCSKQPCPLAASSALHGPSRPAPLRPVASLYGRA